MFCQKCGNELSEGAAFCAKCGTKVEEQSIIQEPQTTLRGDKNERKPHKKRAIIIAGLLLVIALIVLILMPKQPAWVERNGDRGSDDPTEIAHAYLQAMNEPDIKYLSKYWDAQIEEEGEHLKSEDILKKSNYATNYGTETLYLEGAQYEVGEIYTLEKNGIEYENVKVKIKCRTEGMFGGESVFTGYDYYDELTLHKNNTPNGDKWFLASMGEQWMPVDPLP